MKPFAKVPELCTSMIGNRLITKQTPADGIPVSKVMVAEAIDITRETYFCILMDRSDIEFLVDQNICKSCSKTKLSSRVFLGKFFAKGEEHLKQNIASHHTSFFYHTIFGAIILKR